MMMTKKRHYRLGKRPPRHDYRTFQLANYLPITYDPPANCDWSNVMAMPCGMMLNDKLGICTGSGAGHKIQLDTANHGREFTPPDSALLAAYEAYGGYDPNAPLIEDPDNSGEMINPTDQGADLLTVLKYWRSVGIAGHEILAYVQVPLTDLLRRKQATSLFGGQYIGLALPASIDEDADVWDAPADLTGDNEPGSGGGHCVLITGYGDDGSEEIITWGTKKKITPRFAAAYVDERFAVVTYDWASKTINAPNGFALNVLLADLHGLNARRKAA